MVDAIVEIADLRKTYGKVEALAGLNLRVPRGAICGLLGRNGAGKTTTLKALLGMLRPTSGTIRVHGLAVGSSRIKSSVPAQSARSQWSLVRMPRDSFLTDRSTGSSNLRRNFCASCSRQLG